MTDPPVAPGPDEPDPPGSPGTSDDPEHPPADASPDAFAGPSWNGEAPAVPPGTEPRQRRRRTSRRRLRRRRRYGLAMLIVGGLILLAGIYIAVTAILARSKLEDVRAEVHQLRAQIAAGDLDGARATARQITDHASSAHSYTAGPVWALAGDLPAGGAPFETVRTITSQVDVLGQNVLPQVIEATRELDPSTLRRADGTIDLARIQAIAPALNSADSSMTRATARVAAQPDKTWIASVDSARTDLLAQMRSLSKTLHSADLAARIAPQMLGADGVRRYFVAFQNDAEARGTGGLPGAFAIARADHGKLSFERFEPDGALGATQAQLNFGVDYNTIYGNGTSNLYVNSNLSPHFPYAAKTWIKMWAVKTKEHLDGALAVDPEALSALLAVTGPAPLPGGGQVTAANVVSLTQQQAYAKFPKASQNNQRKDYLLDIARAASQQVLRSGVNTTALVKAAGRTGADGRIMMYSTDVDVENDISETSLSGELPSTSAPFAGLSLVNIGGNKLDYYLDRSITWKRTGCGSTRDVTVTIRLTNNAPANLPFYVEERNDYPTYPVRPGDNAMSVYYYATKGATIESFSSPDRISDVTTGSLLGRPLVAAAVKLPRGTTTTIVVRLREPAAGGTPVVLRQPLVNPLQVTVDDQKCG